LFVEEVPFGGWKQKPTDTVQNVHINLTGGRERWCGKMMNLEQLTAQTGRSNWDMQNTTPKHNRRMWLEH